MSPRSVMPVDAFVASAKLSVVPDVTIEQVATSFVFTEGALWHGARQALLFSDIIGDQMHCWNAREGVRSFRQRSHMANGNAGLHAGPQRRRYPGGRRRRHLRAFDRRHRPGRRIVQIGVPSGFVRWRNLLPQQFENAGIHGICLGSVAIYERLNAFVGRHGIHPVIDRSSIVDDAPAGYEQLKSSAPFGKLVIDLG